MRLVGAIACCLLAAASAASGADDAPWTADSILPEPLVITLPGLGSAQGVSQLGERLYFYGDISYDADPAAPPPGGVIAEYRLDFTPTGRSIRLERNGQCLARHPTGLTWDDHLGCLLGNTVDQRATMYRIDWELALEDGNLNRAVRDTIIDDAAVNGCRPVFVTHQNRTLIATADYGDVHPQLRLYDPALLLETAHSSSTDVLVASLPCGSFTQNLWWNAQTQELTFAQNIVAGLGWQLETIRLDQALAAGKIDSPAVVVQRWHFMPHTELEGALVLPDGRHCLVTSSRQNNVIVGRPSRVAPFASPAGSLQLAP